MQRGWQISEDDARRRDAIAIAQARSDIETILPGEIDGERLFAALMRRGYSFGLIRRLCVLHQEIGRG